MLGLHHQLNGHEFEQTLGDSEGQGNLVCCSLWGHKELDTAKWLNNSIVLDIVLISFFYMSLSSFFSTSYWSLSCLYCISLPPLSYINCLSMDGFICGLSILCHWSIFLVYFWFCGSTILSWLLWICSIFWSWEPDSFCSLFLSQDCTVCLGFTCSPEELLWSFSLQWRTLTPLICWGFYFCKKLKDTVICIPWVGTKTLLEGYITVSCLLLTCLYIPSLTWLTTVWKVSVPRSPRGCSSVSLILQL